MQSGPLLEPQADCGVESAEAGRPDEQSDRNDEPPFSLRNEISFFLNKGIPLGLSTVLESGVPPVFNMIVAGHTPQSAALQAALGYGRVFYNCGALSESSNTRSIVRVAVTSQCGCADLAVPLTGMCAGYFGAVVPGCIGAGRKDRIPTYLRRSLVLTSVCLTPFLALQFAASPVLVALSVPPHVAEAVGVYCRLMIVTALVQLLENHMKTIFVSLGYARSATVNSLVTGIGVDMTCTYLFVYRWQLGIRGTALAQIALRTSRLLIWIAFALRYRLTRTILGRSGPTMEKLLSPREVRIFFGLAAPMTMQFLSGWLIFELQMI
eukprot:3379975-Prymnesium_polylepis.1